MEIAIQREDTLGGGETSIGIAQVQSEVANITTHLQDMSTEKAVSEHV
jgi:hypothetical protein